MSFQQDLNIGHDIFDEVVLRAEASGDRVVALAKLLMTRLKVAIGFLRMVVFGSDVPDIIIMRNN